MFHCLLALLFLIKENISNDSEFCFLYVMCLFSLVAIEIFYLCLMLSTTTMIYLYKSYLYFLRFLNLFVILQKIKRTKKFLAIVFLYTYFLLSLSSPSGIPVTHVFDCLTVFHWFLTLCSFFLNIFSFLDGFYWSVSNCTDCYFYHLHSVNPSSKWVTEGIA